VSGSEAAIVVQGFTKSTTFDVIKKEASHFAEHSESLIRLLDHAAGIHPFIQGVSLLPSLSSLLSSADAYCVVAVDVFKIAITLAVDKHANDQKLTTLHVMMCDMMEVMTLSVKSSLP